MKVYIDDKYLDFVCENDIEASYFKNRYSFEDSSLAFSRGTYDAKLIKKVSFVRKHKEHNFIYNGFSVDFLKECKSQGFNVKIESKLSKIAHLSKEYEDEEIKELFPFEYNDHQVGAMKKLLKSRNAIVKAVTSAGKSYIFASYIKLTKLPALILVNNVTLCGQLAKTISEVCGISCGVWNGKTKRDGEVVVATIGSIYSLPNVNRFKVLIIDECHRASAESFQEFLKSSSFPIKLAFSATPRKNNFDFQKIRQFFGEIAFEIGAETLMDSGVVVKPIIKFIKVKCPKTMDWPSAYQKGIIENKERNNAIIEIVKNKKVPTLILIKDVVNGHGNILKEEIENLGRTVEFISGDSKNRQKAIEDLDNGRLDVLIATSILNEGVSIKNVHMLIMASGMKSLVDTSQKIGRGLRKMEGKESVLVIDFDDTGNRFLKSHSSQRKSIYEKIGFKDIQDLTLEEFLKQ